MRFRQIIENRWFAIADLACVSISIVLWELEPSLGWTPIVIALFPWVLRLGAGRFPFFRTHFEIPILIFFFTAGMGVWAAYNQAGAWSKFWLLIGGILLFYSLAGQPQSNFWIIAGSLSIIGVGIAVYFLLTDNWQLNPAKIGLLNQIGLWWMKFRPPFSISSIRPNTAGGLIAITAPFLVASGIHAWLEKKVLLSLLVIAGGIAASVGFLMVTSRGAAIALIVGMIVWALKSSGNRLTRFIPDRVRITFTYIFILLVLASGVILLSLGPSIDLANSNPGLYNSSSRPELANSTVKLIGDFPFTGSGLNSFPGLFSSYILNIPFFYLLNSHNLFLDVTLEQGILGGLAFIFIYLASILLTLTINTKTRWALLVWASLASLVIIVVHGLVDEIIYDPGEAPLVFLLPGFAYALVNSNFDFKSPSRSIFNGVLSSVSSNTRRIIFRGSILVLIVLAGLAYGYRKTLLASWYADLGAVQMAKIELADFPSGNWDASQYINELRSPEGLFLKALQYDPDNRTATHRLGLIATLRGDYSTALQYLNRAYQADQGYRGINKSLAYCYAWTGQFDKASKLLANIPEAKQEMATYSSWWETQGRDDLARRATTMFDLLEGVSS